MHVLKSIQPEQLVLAESQLTLSLIFVGKTEVESRPDLMYFLYQNCTKEESGIPIYVFRSSLACPE